MHIGKFNEESEPYLLRRLTPELHVEWIVARLPAKLESDARAIRRALRSEGKASDVEEAMRRCMEVCDDAYDSTLGEPDVGAAVLQHVPGTCSGPPCSERSCYLAILVGRSPE